MYNPCSVQLLYAINHIISFAFINAHNGQQKSNEESAKRIRRLTVRATHSKSWRDRVPDFRSRNAEADGVNEVRTNGTESRLVFDNLRE